MAAAATAKIYHGNRAAIVAASASIPWTTTASFLPLGKQGRMMRELKLKRTRLASSSSSGPPSSSSSSSSPRGGGVYSAQEQLLELTAENVDRVLEEVRPYLIADGGNVEVDSVENGVVSLELQGACGSCVSSTTTMKMGIERVLKEKFGDAVKQVCQVGYEDQMPPNGITVEAVNAHLDILRPAIQNYGGIVQVISVEGGHCVVQYTGPESIGSGIKAAIKEKFPVLVDVVLTAAAA